MSENADNKRAFLERLTFALDLMSDSAKERTRGRQYARDHTTEGLSRPPDWDEYFHAIAQVTALKSKDINRKVGAVIVGDGNVILSTGFNGFARGVREIPERTMTKQEKLRWITHAETNAIFNAARLGIPLVGGTLYVTTFPCGGCAQAIVQSGIARIFTYGEYWENDPNGYEKALEILAEGHVLVDAPRVRSEDSGLRKAQKAQEQEQTRQLELIASEAHNDAHQKSARAAASALKKATTLRSTVSPTTQKRGASGRG